MYLNFQKDVGSWYKLNSTTKQNMSSGDTAESLASTGVPVIILILVGFLFDRIHAFPTNKALPWINKFVFYLGIPALVFKALAVCDFINSQSFNWNFVLAFLVWRAISKIN
jgi:predicted permease